MLLLLPLAVIVSLNLAINAWACVVVRALNLDIHAEISFGKQDNDPYEPARIDNTTVVWIESKSPDNGYIVIGDLLTRSKIKIKATVIIRDLDLSQSKVVWLGRNNEEINMNDIYILDLTTKNISKLSNKTGNYVEPKIDGDYLVWYSHENTNLSSIIIYNLKETNTAKLHFNSSILGLEIKDENIYYVQQLNNSPSLWNYNIIERKKYQLLDRIDHSAHGGLSLDNNLLAWGGKWNISIYNLTSGILTHVSYSSGKTPVINNNKLAYMDISHANETRGSIWVSYIYYLNTGTKIQISEITNTGYSGEQLYPSIHNDWVVWYNMAVCESWLEKNFFVVSLSSLLLICLMVSYVYIKNKKKS